VSLVPAHRADSPRDFATLGAVAWCGLVAGAGSDIDRVLLLVAAVEDRFVPVLAAIGATLPLLAWAGVALGRIAARRPWLVWITAGGLAAVGGQLLLEDRVVSRLIPDVDNAVLAAAPVGLAFGAVALGWWLNRPRRRQIG
jgi:predicted tellurium resistance membrane protein TerC